MADEIVDPLRPQLADYERQIAELRNDLATATNRRERSKVRRHMRRIQQRALLTRLRGNRAIRW